MEGRHVEEKEHVEILAIILLHATVAHAVRR